VPYLQASLPSAHHFEFYCCAICLKAKEFLILAGLLCSQAETAFIETKHGYASATGGLVKAKRPNVNR